MDSSLSAVGTKRGIYIYLLGDDDARVISTMAGWVDDEFVMAFRVSVAESYALYWPANSPIELIPEG